MKTTLNKIRAHGPCTNGWEKLLKNLGKTKADDEPLALTDILESNGLDDALWCLRAVDGHEREMRLFAVDCVRRVQHLMTDKRSRDALDVAKRFANGLATQTELAAAWAAAGDAVDAADAAADAAGDAVDAADAAADAARAAGDAVDAVAAARDAAWAAARAAGASARAAGASARDAARDAARAAAWAARAAADAAAWVAAGDAARAAWAAARAAADAAAWVAAGDAAWADAWAAQANLFILMCEGCYD